MEPSRARDLTAAGKVRMTSRVTAIANSHGVDAGMATADVQATVLSMNDAGSGWASYLGADPDGSRPGALG